MRRSFVSSVLNSLFMAWTCASVGCGDGGAAIPDPDIGTSSPRPQTVSLYDESKVLDFKLTFTPAEWAVFQKVHDNPPPPALRNTYTKVYAHCGFEALGMKFPDAACRPKGNPLNWAREKKPQFVVKFNHWDSEGRFLTLRSLNLEANPFSDAPVRDRLGMWVMREVGVKAPRCNHVRVYNNDVLLGLYMNIEEVDKEFLQWQFTNPNGNLYSQGLYLETNNKKMSDTSRLTDLLDRVMSEPLDGNHDTFFAALGRAVNIPQMLTETASEVVLPTGDNWSNGGTNYFFYDSPANGQFYLLPWDLDTIMDSMYAPSKANPYTYWGHAELGLSPNKMLQLVYQKPEWKAQFEDRLVQIRDTVYNRLPAYIDKVCAQIRDDFAKDPNHSSTLEDFDADCKYLKKHVADRTAYLRQVLQR